MKNRSLAEKTELAQQKFYPESQIGELLFSVLKSRRRAIVYDLGRRIYSQLKTKASSAHFEAEQSSGWIEVYSLSQLRSIVGGRFQNLKDRWVDAGFPLRAHRGDRKDPALVNSRGWVELANWIGKQGYEAALATAEDGFLFSVRCLGEIKRSSE